MSRSQTVLGHQWFLLPSGFVVRFNVLHATLTLKLLNQQNSFQDSPSFTKFIKPAYTCHFSFVAASTDVEPGPLRAITVS